MRMKRWRETRRTLGRHRTLLDHLLNRPAASWPLGRGRCAGSARVLPESRQAAWIKGRTCVRMLLGTSVLPRILQAPRARHGSEKGARVCVPLMVEKEIAGADSKLYACASTLRVRVHRRCLCLSLLSRRDFGLAVVLAVVHTIVQVSSAKRKN